MVVTGLGGTASATLSTACQDFSLRAGRVMDYGRGMMGEGRVGEGVFGDVEGGGVSGFESIVPLGVGVDLPVGGEVAVTKLEPGFSNGVGED